MKKLTTKMISFILVVVMLFTTNVTAFANSTNTLTSTIQTELSEILISESDVVNDIIQKSSAGLAWGPVTIGNIELSMTNPHTGYVSPRFPRAEHINFNIRNADTRRNIANYHIVKYTTGSTDCLYVYDSVSRTEVIDDCFRNWTSAVSAFVSVVQEVVGAALSEADWMATIAIWGVIIVVLADLIIPMDPVPILPFSPPIPNQPSEFEMFEYEKHSAA